MVDEIHPQADLIAAARRIADKIAGNSSTAVQAAKQAVRLGTGQPIEQAIAIMVEAHWRSAVHPDRGPSRRDPDLVEVGDHQPPGLKEADLAVGDSWTRKCCRTSRRAARWGGGMLGNRWCSIWWFSPSMKDAGPPSPGDLPRGADLLGQEVELPLSGENRGAGLRTLVDVRTNDTLVTFHRGLSPDRVTIQGRRRSLQCWGRTREVTRRNGGIEHAVELDAPGSPEEES